MRVLVVEDDVKPDFKDIQDILESCLPEAMSEHKESFTEIDFESLNADDYSLCITDILEYAGRVTFNSPEFRVAFSTGINYIAKLYKKLNCNFVILTKIPCEELEKAFETVDNRDAASVLFEDSVRLKNELLNRQKNGVSFTIYNIGDIRIITKPYDQDGKVVFEYDEWKIEFANVIKETTGKNVTSQQERSAVCHDTPLSLD